MKAAIFIFDNIQQVVLTPESDLDKRVLELIEKGTTGTMRGSVYTCRGGWVRFEQARRQSKMYGAWLEEPPTLEDGQSLIVRIGEPEKKPEDPSCS